MVQDRFVNAEYAFKAKIYYITGAALPSHDRERFHRLFPLGPVLLYLR